MKRVFTPAKKKTILLVDDDQITILVYREKLEAKGFTVETAKDREGALEIVRKGTVNLVIVDLCLPAVDTVEFIARVRSDASAQSLLIVGLSNPYLSGLTHAAMEAGANECLTKLDHTPEQLLELAARLGIFSTRAHLAALVDVRQLTRAELVEAFLHNKAGTLARLRASHQIFARAADEDARATELVAMHRQLRAFAGAALFGFDKIARLNMALEGLLVELRAKPAKVTPSVVRTIAQAIDTLASLLDRVADSPAPTSPPILVVDDETLSREAVCSALHKAGLEPVSLDDAVAAQHLLERDHFDLIFLDVEMPGQTGLELCVKIREMEPNRMTPIVFVTSHSDFGSRAQSTLSGGNDFIAKPFLFVELAVKALTWLDKENAALSSGAKERATLPGNSFSAPRRPHESHTI